MKESPCDASSNYHLFYCVNKSTLVLSQTIDLAPLSREECNDVLLKRGFYKKAQESDPVPEEFKDAPQSQQDRKEEL